MLIEKKPPPRFCEPAAAIFSILGTLLIALNNGSQFFGFVAYFIANILLINFFIKKDMYWLTGQHCVFMATTLLGLYSYSQ